MRVLQIPHNNISFKYVDNAENTIMPESRKLLVVTACLMIVFSGSSCRVWNKAFGPKYGCPANGKSFGAERILSGEKPPRAKKFKA
jgi:hypothetical protein